MIVEPLQLVVAAAFGGPQPGMFGHPGIRPDITAVELAAAESRLAAVVPEPLKDYYTIAGKHDGMMAAHFRFLPPGELRIVDAHLVFCHENQHVMEWGIRLDELALPDPPVYVRLTDGPDAGAWTVESAILSAFLLGAGSWQAVLSMDDSAECKLPPNKVPSLLRWFTPVGDPELRRDATLVGFVDRKRWTVAAFDSKHSMLYVGTSAEDGLDEFEERSGLDLNRY
ncbi:hypothetical protein Drose_15340 [Dactylosporangium roseum]|uniref:Knr4/Smi1-like domain-containing protein n=1 Tax=Dactylosporangium roseum TaxID=47989 RepID=A0ABY5ZBJ9_9ACTN|nr:hypothetical protein [Dactylosporangium roseum]UWZ39486.1 hypothetical protein Drose_15340 [Dactylosporangium roseum]